MHPFLFIFRALLQIVWVTKRIYSTQPQTLNKSIGAAKCFLETALRNVEAGRSLSGGVLHVALRAALRRSHDALRGEWSLDDLGMISPPQSPFGGFRGKKRKSDSSPLQRLIYSFIRADLKSQAAPASGSRASSLHIVQKGCRRTLVRSTIGY